jgi:DNA-binding LacI/PurR family transcriptional regulator
MHDFRPPPRRQPTMHDVARYAGVHQTTVSRALRNDRRLPAATCARIQRIAEKMGYRPHPLVSALIALRRSRHPPRYHATLGYLLRGEADAPSREEHFRGLRAAAAMQGYEVTPFLFEADSRSQQRLSRALRARGIHGLVIAPLPEAHGHFDLEWEQFSTVVIEYTFTTPVFDRVVHDSYAGMRRIMTECRCHRLRRIGLTLSRTGHERTERLNTAAYWAEQKADDFFAAVPPLILPEWHTAAFQDWFERTRPEVVVTSNEFLAEILAWCARRRLRPGADLQLANVNAAADGPVSGVYQDPFAIGVLAARLVIERLVQNERGVPTLPHTLLTRGTWVEGATLRAPPP